MIAVSKLCCPVCWELLQVLRKDSDINPINTPPQFTVRGSHSRVYATMLPPWIRPQQKEQMMSKFQSYLGSELVAMVSALNKIHSTKCEDGKTSGISDVSSSSSISQLALSTIIKLTERF